MKHLLAVAIVATACTGSAPPHARAQRIGKLEETIGGPHAIGQVGDWLLENDQVRFVIADKGVGRVNTTFGGTLVDADLQRVGGDGKGNDQLAELLPGFVFTVIDPTDVCVPTLAGACPAKGQTEDLADGSDGKPAEILVRGVGGDLFQMVALLNTGLVFPSQLEITQVYKLEPGARYVTIETTIKNTSSGAHPFPYLDPASISSSLFKGLIPDVPVQLSAPLGQFPLIGGEQKLFAPGVTGFNVRFSIEDAYTTNGGFPAFPGRAVDFLASAGPGVSYGLALPMSPDNYVNTFKAGYPGQDITPYSMLLPFTYAGVTGAYMYNPPAQLEAGEQRTYTCYFVVGKGDVGSIYDAILDLRQVPTGTFGGRVVDDRSSIGVAHANVVVLDASGTKIIDQLETDAGGNFLGRLPAGTYSFLVLSDDRLDGPADGDGAPAKAPVPFVITAGAQTGELVQMPAPATIAISALDELGRRAPAKIQLLGHDARIKGVDGRNILYSLALGERVRPTAYDGSDRYVEGAWWTKDGRVLATVRPGTYDVVVSRGPEYEVTTKTITVKAGELATEQLDLQRSFDTPGWVSGDFHIHSAPSTDSGLPIADRVTSCAAEGLEVAVATDHNFITDYAPVIANQSLDPWLLGIPGMELTTFEMGHFNGYPLRVDPGSTRGGEFLWAKQRPQQLFDMLRGLAIDPANSIVQVNHPRQAVLGYWAQFFVDQDTAQPYTPKGIMALFAPYGEEFQAASYSTDFDAVELLTGRRVEDIHTFVTPNPLPPGMYPDPQPVPGTVLVDGDNKPKFPGTVETWFAMLDRGSSPTGMGTSDSHHLLGDEPGYARTLLYVGEGKDTPGGYSRDDVIGAIKAHRAITTNAPFIDMTIGSAMIGDTVSKTGPVAVDIHVRAPRWAPVNHLVVYSNSKVVADMAIPTGTDFTTTVTITPTTDAWVVAEVTGDANMFPVLTPTEFPPLDVSVMITALTQGIQKLDLGSLPLAGALKPQRLHTSTPYAITNPIWIDANGDNTWTPPKPPLARTGTTTAPRPDVRARFEALPEWSP